MKNFTKSITLCVVLSVYAYLANAQVKIGDNPTTINKAAILELESGNKGLLFPRVNLTNTTVWGLAAGSTPVAGMVVYNLKTTASGFSGTAAYPAHSSDGTGIYYWDGTGWVSLRGFKGDAGTTGADGKTLLNGTVAPINGSGNDGDFYINTATNMIYGPKVAGSWPAGVSLVGPQGPAGAPGAIGAQGPQGPAGANGIDGVGGKSQAGTGINITGSGTAADPYIINNTVVDTDNQTISSFDFDNVTKKLTLVLERGNTKTVDISALKATASNGLGVDAVTGEVQLGGTLLKPTTITADAAKTLAIAGLQAGMATDKIVVADGNGVLKTVDQSTVAPEPLQIQGSTNKATDNNVPAYLNSNFAVGDFTGSTSTKKLEVKGDFKAFAQAADGSYYNMETNNTSIAGGGVNFISVANNPNFLTASEVGVLGISRNGNTLMSKIGNATSVFTQSSTGLLASTANPNYTSAFALTENRFSINSTNLANQQRTEMSVNSSDGIKFNYQNTAGNAEGNYLFPRNNGTANQVLTTNGSAGQALLSWKDISAIVPATTADNGLTKNANNIQLGGALTAATTITTDAAKTLAIAGLQTGDATGKLVVVDPTSNILKTVDQSTLSVEPWRIENTTNPATLNNQNIYQNGNVGLGDFTINKPIAKLDVRGAIRGGAPNPLEVQGASAIGENSVALGNGNSGIGKNSMAFGSGNEVSGENAAALGAENFVSSEGGMAFGVSNEVSGKYAVALGTNNLINGEGGLVSGFGNSTGGKYAAAIGRSNVVKGQEAFAVGFSNISTSNNSVMLGEGLRSASKNDLLGGRYNAIVTGSAANWVATEALFQLGNGVDDANRANALTVLKNGNIGTDLAIAPTEKLDIGSGNVRVRDINTVAGTTTDKVVVADGNGVLKTVDQSTLLPEPWQVQGTADKATANAQNIYQTGKVAIGKNPVAAALALGISLDVEGAIRGGSLSQNELQGMTLVGKNSVTFGTENSGSGENSMAFGTSNEARGEYAVALGADNVVGGQGGMAAGFRNSTEGDYSAAIGRYNVVKGQEAFAAGFRNYSTSNHSMMLGEGLKSASINELLGGRYNAITTGNGSSWVATDPLFQLGNGVDENNRDNALTIFKNADIDINGQNVRMPNLPSTLAAQPSDAFIISGPSGNLKKVSSVTAAPKFFYSPSVVLPTANANLPAGVSYDAGTQTFTADLYAIYSNQFGMTGDVAGAGRTAIKSNSATSLPVLPAVALEYFVTYFDNTVFDPTSISLDDNGIMTYKILPAATVTEKTYMNIVFKVK